MAYIGPTPTSLAPTLGPFIIGTSVACVLTGAIITQAYSYFDKYRDDKLLIKVGVAIVTIAVLTRLFLDVEMIWLIGVTHFGDYAALHEQPHSIAIGNLTTGIVGLVSQIFFADRTWRTWNRSYFLAILFGLLITATFLGSMLGPITHIVGLFSLVPPFADMWLWCAACSDLLITGLLTIKLWQSRREPDLPQNTQRVIDKFLILILSTAFITTVCAIVDACLVEWFEDDNNIHTTFTLLVSRFYAVCLLFTLNSRQKLREGLHKSNTGRPSDTDRPPLRRKPKAILVTREQAITSHDPTAIDLERVADRRPAVRDQRFLPADERKATEGSDGSFPPHLDYEAAQ